MKIQAKHFLDLFKRHLWTRHGESHLSLVTERILPLQWQVSIQYFWDAGKYALPVWVTRRRS